MTTEEARQLWDTYEQAWAPVSPDERQHLLRQSLDPACTLSNPLLQGQGFDQVIAAIEGLQQQSPGAIVKTHTFLTHHDQLLAAWDIFDKDGTEILKGYSTAQFNGAGRFTTLCGFWAS